ncbi:MAG: hypothetical protein QG566_265 [Patescibacteria group bacterium]|jgi:hypothetical protein|nr:hypothetical protein [Patescibacteria group bacterium]
MEQQTINNKSNVPVVAKEFKKNINAIILACVQIIVIIFNIFRVRVHPESLLYYVPFWWIIAIIPALLILFSNKKDESIYKIGKSLMTVEYIFFFFYFLSIVLSKLN